MLKKTIHKFAQNFDLNKISNFYPVRENANF